MVVVGAGLAGLAAALRLSLEGHSVTVLEARGELGGRTRSRPVEGDVLELGGQFIARQHCRMRQLAADSGLRLERDRFASSPMRWRRSDDPRSMLLPPVRPKDVACFPALLVRLRAAAGSLGDGGDAFRASPAARSLDRRSVGEWLAQSGLSPGARHAVDCAFGQLFSVELQQLSLLQLSAFVSQVGGVVPMLYGGLGMNAHLSAGTGTLCGAIAERLRAPVRLGAPALTVGQDRGGVAIGLAGGDLVEADRAIIAIPAHLVSRLRFDPPLDAELVAANASVEFGRATKVSAVVAPRSRLAARSFLGGPLVGAGWRTRRVLYGLAIGEGASEGDTDVLVEDLCAGFDVDIREVEHAESVRWGDEPFTGGTYVHFLPGQLTRYGQDLRRGHGLVLFAGAERSSWPVHMEGAVQSGYRAAECIAREACCTLEGGRHDSQAGAGVARPTRIDDR